ncbi:MAG: thioredoxin domain-containing protein [Candidatus Heimdallarchaeota archaeon]
MNTSKKKQNRLINEKSPYLLQHATNPVDWYPWGPEAFEKAKKEDKPIFLSIGYSTCHWCHVMAHESFEDPEVAKLMNETFVSIKVDREERPEIDNLYMTVCQMITGSGGWPLTIIMDADKKPFTAGTYFPKESRFGRIGMMDLIPRIKDYWVNQREMLISSAHEVIEQLQKSTGASGDELTQDYLDEAFKEASLAFDEKYGGFRGAPKFPTPHKLLFLLRYWYRTKNAKALEIVESTLTAMRLGGIYDHVGFGFHRYSTDSMWLLPHFEKMLYDQALTAIAYTETYLATKNEFYKNVAEEIFTYVLRDMTSEEGGFFSAEDADSEGEEGLFYTWPNSEIEEVLGKDRAKQFVTIYNLEKQGNFVNQATQEKIGRSIPHLRKSLNELAKELNVSTEKLVEELEYDRLKLFEYREKRIHPHKDDKILTDWNGLMIAALAIAGRAFENEKYIQAAENATNFILKNLTLELDRLLHRFREGEAAIQGMIDDYSFFIWGLLELYQSTFTVSYLKQAIALNKILIDNFWDDQDGGFYFTTKDAEELLVRKKEIYDGAVPSGNSVAMLNLIRISRMTADIELEEKAAKINKAFSFSIEQALLAHSMFLSALEYVFGSAFEVVIVGQSKDKNTDLMLKAINSEFIPNKVLLFLPTDNESPEILEATEFVQYKTTVDEKTTAHVCINRFCKFPTNDVNKMLELLNIK